MSRRRLPVALLLAALAPLPAAARTLAIPDAFRVVAAEYGTPAGLLFAIALAESGRAAAGTPLPWPWVLNVAGEAHWFASRAAAAAALEAAVAEGQAPDIGLMQINWRYHRDKLGAPHAALDPWLNLRAGAAVLAAEYRATGDWWQAVGRYHSHTPARAHAYRERVLAWYRRLG